MRSGAAGGAREKNSRHQRTQTAGLRQCLKAFWRTWEKADTEPVQGCLKRVVWFPFNRVNFHAAWSEHCFKDQETGVDEKHSEIRSEKFIIKMPQKSQIQEDAALNL